MVAKGTIETKLCRITQEKQEISDSILDGSECNGDFDVFNQLMKEIKGELK
jgi:hypothetical protein